MYAVESVGYVEYLVFTGLKKTSFIVGVIPSYFFFMTAKMD